MSYRQAQTYNVQSTDSQGSNDNTSARKRRIASMLRKRQQRIFQTTGSTSHRLCAQRTSENVRRISLLKCGASFTNPTKWGIITAIGECKTNAEKMMGPPGADIIKHHYEEMMKLVNRLE